MQYGAYRRDDFYSLDPIDNAEPITIRLEPGVVVKESGSKQLLIYREDEPYGWPLGWAIRHGWCRVVDPDSDR